MTVCAASALASTMLIEAIRMLPNNSRLDRRVEFAGAVRHHFGPRAATGFQVLLHLSLQSLNIASIIDVACTFDKLIATTGAGGTFAAEFWPNPSLGLKDRAWISTMYDSGDDSVTLAVTAGYALVGILCVPMGMFNIDDNIAVQIVSFAFLVLLMLEFIGQCALDFEISGSPSRFPPMVGDSFRELVRFSPAHGLRFTRSASRSQF
jgi:hypothetical protein